MNNTEWHSNAINEYMDMVSESHEPEQVELELTTLYITYHESQTVGIQLWNVKKVQVHCHIHTVYQYTVAGFATRVCRIQNMSLNVTLNTYHHRRIQ